MRWVHKRQADADRSADPIVAAIDLNSSRAVAVAGKLGQVPHVQALEGVKSDFPLFIIAEGRRLEVGRAALGVRRLSPHLVFSDFLAKLGENHVWKSGRQQLDAERGLSLVLDSLRRPLGRAGAYICVLPSYVSRAQASIIASLAGSATMPLRGTVAAPLAQGVHALTIHPPFSKALILDVDEHAFSASLVAVERGQLYLAQTSAWPRLRTSVWMGCMLDRLADQCIRQSRRDPRESPAAEQSLFDQLDEVLGHVAMGKAVEMYAQSDNWHQSMLVRPADLAAAVRPLVTQVLEKAHSMILGDLAGAPLQAILATPTAARLPGMLANLERRFAQAPPVQDSEGDFGEGLMQEAGGVCISVLEPDAAARGAHQLARLFVPSGHGASYLDQAVPLADVAVRPASPSVHNAPRSWADPDV